MPTTSYRYVLNRPTRGSWATGRGRVLFVMLNPSTATETQDDATVRRCVGFAHAWGFGQLTIVNLFAARSTDSALLQRMTDPVGPDNDRVIAEQAALADRIVAAWGNRGWLHRRDGPVLDLLTRHGDVWSIGKLTKSGHPRHPVRLSAATPLRLYVRRKA